jgi:hypothetical protein
MKAGYGMQTHNYKKVYNRYGDGKYRAPRVTENSIIQVQLKDKIHKEPCHHISPINSRDDKNMGQNNRTPNCNKCKLQGWQFQMFTATRVLIKKNFFRNGAAPASASK